MKALLTAALLGVSLAGTAQAAPISYGDITGGGLFNGSTSSNTAWAQENPVDGNEVNFWTFSGKMGDLLSVQISSILNEFDAAVSLFFGSVEDTDLLFGNFQNSADFGSVTYVAGSLPFGTSGLDVSLLDILLPSTGIYTLAIGGEDFLNLSDSYGYELSVYHAMVSEPATLMLMLTSLAGIAAVRRKA